MAPVISSSALASSITPRPYSFAVFGCTGNAGRGVAYHVVKSAILGHAATATAAVAASGESTAATATNNTITAAHVVRVALAGRNREKVKKVLESIRYQLRQEGVLDQHDDTNIINTNDDVVDDDSLVDIIVADITNEQSMQDLASSTHILISCAGPYGRYGEASVKACVECKTHYVDITGEVAFIEDMIHKYGSKAETNGVTLCPFSGYDCLPSELGMWLVGRALETYGNNSNNNHTQLGKLELNVRGEKGGFPRGTMLTLLDGADEQREQSLNRTDRGERFYPKEYRPIAKAALSPYHFLLPKFQMGQYTGPNFMSIINVPVLCRAAPTLGFSSNDLTISDRLSFVERGTWYKGYYGLFQAQAYILALFAGGMLFAIPQVRNFLRKRIDAHSFDFHGDVHGKVYVDALGAPSVSSSSLSSITTTDRKIAYAIAQCIYPGDPGVFATGFFATAVANALLEATACNHDTNHDDNTTNVSLSGESSNMRPLVGFHSPVAALHKCRAGLLVDHLRAMGAQIKVEVVFEENMAREEVETTALRSKL